MQIYEVLKADHDQLRDLLGRLVAAGADDEETRRGLIDELKAALVPHSRAEEAVLYNSLREIQASRKLVLHSYREHAEAEALLHALSAMESLHLDWKSTAEKFRESLEHHIREEETELFPCAQALLIDREAEMMADAFLRLKEEIKGQNDLQGMAEWVRNLLPSRLRPDTHRL